MTAILTPQTPPRTPPTSTIPCAQHFVLDNVTWQQYLAISDALPERGGLRINYDRGTLELMTTSTVHEKYKKWFGRFVDIMAEEGELPTVSAGQMTFRKEDLERGMEPDDCYWIANEMSMRTVRQWFPDRHPPPDLALEIEVSRSIVNRLRILAALRVAEVWCFDGNAVRVYVLDSNYEYQLVDRSPSFPSVDLAGLVSFFHMSETQDSLTVTRAFRAWVREQLAKK